MCVCVCVCVCVFFGFKQVCEEDFLCRPKLVIKRLTSFHTCVNPSTDDCNGGLEFQLPSCTENCATVIQILHFVCTIGCEEYAHSAKHTRTHMACFEHWEEKKRIRCGRHRIAEPNGNPFLCVQGEEKRIGGRHAHTHTHTKQKRRCWRGKKMKWKPCLVNWMLNFSHWTWTESWTWNGLFCHSRSWNFSIVKFVQWKCFSRKRDWRKNIRFWLFLHSFSGKTSSTRARRARTFWEFVLSERPHFPFFIQFKSIVLVLNSDLFPFLPVSTHHSPCVRPRPPPSISINLAFIFFESSWTGNAFFDWPVVVCRLNFFCEFCRLFFSCGFCFFTVEELENRMQKDKKGTLAFGVFRLKTLIVPSVCGVLRSCDPLGFQFSYFSSCPGCLVALSWQWQGFSQRPWTIRMERKTEEEVGLFFTISRLGQIESTGTPRLRFVFHFLLSSAGWSCLASSNWHKMKWITGWATWSDAVCFGRLLNGWNKMTVVICVGVWAWEASDDDDVGRSTLDFCENDKQMKSDESDTW